MRIYLRHRLVSLVVAFLAAVGMAAELDAGVWYGSFVKEVGRNEQSLIVSVIATPNGFIASGSMHYYVKDYQGNVRQVVNADGVVEQDNHYYPYGMLMGESSNILASAHGYKSVSFNPYLFGTKEYLTTASANLLDFAARTYDPATLFFITQDINAGDYHWLFPYAFCAADPVNFIDPDGRDAVVIFNGNKITVKAIIYLTGEYANEDLARMGNDDIKNTWGRVDKFSYNGNTYDVKWDVSVRVKGDEEEDYNGVNNYMKVIIKPENKKASFVRETNHGNLRAFERYKISLCEDFPLSHEFGHMLGLKDRYDKDTHKPYDGWMNDIMAEATYQNGRTISNHHLETIFKSIINLYSLYNILRNIPILNIFIPNKTKYWINNKTRAEKDDKTEEYEL